MWCSNNLFFGTCTNGIRNGRVPSGDDEATPAKRSKVAGNADSATASPTPREPFELAQLKTYGNYFSFKNPWLFSKLFPFVDNLDTLICGNCKEMFHNLSDIIDHKKHYCKLRFTCKCAPKISGSESNDGRDSGNWYSNKCTIIASWYILLFFRSWFRGCVIMQFMQRNLFTPMGPLRTRSKNAFPIHLWRNGRQY